MENQLGRRRQRRQLLTIGQWNVRLLTIGQWNVRTLLDREGANRPERRTALVAMELAKYNIDIAALCETRFSESGSLSDLEYSFFWSGKPEGERREAGVGFAIKKDIITKLTEMCFMIYHVLSVFHIIHPQNLLYAHVLINYN